MNASGTCLVFLLPQVLRSQWCESGNKLWIFGNSCGFFCPTYTVKNGSLFFSCAQVYSVSICLTVRCIIYMNICIHTHVHTKMWAKAILLIVTSAAFSFYSAILANFSFVFVPFFCCLFFGCACPLAFTPSLIWTSVILWLLRSAVSTQSTLEADLLPQHESACVWSSTYIHHQVMSLIHLYIGIYHPVIALLCRACGIFLLMQCV